MDEVTDGPVATFKLNAREATIVTTALRLGQMNIDVFNAALKDAKDAMAVEGLEPISDLGEVWPHEFDTIFHKIANPLEIEDGND